MAWVADLERGLQESKIRAKTFVKSYVATINKVKAMRGSFIPSLTLDNGSIGLIRKGRSKDVETFDTERSRPMEVFQIIDKDNALVKWSDSSLGDMTLVWLKGFSTTGLADGKTMTIGRFVQVTGTRQYATALGGSKTLMVIEPFDIDKELVGPSCKGTWSKAEKMNPRLVFSMEGQNDQTERLS